MKSNKLLIYIISTVILLSVLVSGCSLAGAGNIDSTGSVVSLETGKSAMLWVIFPSIIFFFDSVRKTAEMLRVLRIYPIDLVLRFNGELEIIMNRLSNGEMCNEAD